jgi:predicted transport protein
MTSFEDHLAYAEPAIRPILVELRNRIAALDGRVKEGVTPKQRVTYSVARIFAEVKVLKNEILIRFFDRGLSDPRGIVANIPKSYKWQHEKEIRINTPELLDYAMIFIQASFRSALTTLPPSGFGRD